MNTNLTGFSLFSNIFEVLCFGKKVASEWKGLTQEMDELSFHMHLPSKQTEQQERKGAKMAHTLRPAIIEGMR